MAQIKNFEDLSIGKNPGRYSNKFTLSQNFQNLVKIISSSIISEKPLYQFHQAFLKDLKEMALMNSSGFFLLQKVPVESFDVNFTLP